MQMSMSYLELDSNGIAYSSIFRFQLEPARMKQLHSFCLGQNVARTHSNIRCRTVGPCNQQAAKSSLGSDQVGRDEQTAACAAHGQQLERLFKALVGGIVQHNHVPAKRNVTREGNRKHALDSYGEVARYFCSA
jgi:hypothetical protein